MNYGNLDVFLTSHIKQYKTNGRLGYGECPFHPDENKSIIFDNRLGQFKCHSCRLSGTIESFARKLGVLPPVVAPSPIAPQPQTHLSNPPLTPQGPAASVGQCVANEPMPPSDFVFSDLTGAEFFRRHGINPFPHGSPVPSEYKELCRHAYKEIADYMGTINDRVMDKIDQADEVWKKCTSAKEYERFLTLLKEAQEISVDALVGLQ